MVNTEEAREALELQKAYFALVSAISSNELLPVLAGEPIASTLFPQITSSLLLGATTLLDAPGAVCAGTHSVHNDALSSS